MTKRTRPVQHYPGEVERLTTLIERKAKEIAQVLLWDVADAETQSVDPRQVARPSSRRRTGGQRSGAKGKSRRTGRRS